MSFGFEISRDDIRESDVRELCRNRSYLLQSFSQDLSGLERLLGIDERRQGQRSSSQQPYLATQWDANLGVAGVETSLKGRFFSCGYPFAIACLLNVIRPEFGVDEIVAVVAYVSELRADF